MFCKIHAGTTSVGQEELLFLDLNQTLWPADGEKSSGKLKGQHSWPFSFTIPVKVSPAESKGKPYSTPPNVSERASPAYIDYRIDVTIKRGALKVNQTYVDSLSRIGDHPPLLVVDLQGASGM